MCQPDLDSSTRLAEWIEIIRILGADKIDIYVISVHPKVEKLLKRYEELGTVSIRKISAWDGSSDKDCQKRFYLRNGTKFNHNRHPEHIALNDCFFRNMYDFRYVVPLDLDEVIVPVKHKDWHDLIRHLERNRTADAYLFRNFYFFTPEHQEGLVMMKLVERSRSETKNAFKYSKSFQKTSSVAFVQITTGKMLKKY